MKPEVFRKKKFFLPNIFSLSYGFWDWWGFKAWDSRVAKLFWFSTFSIYFFTLLSLDLEAVIIEIRFHFSKLLIKELTSLFTILSFRFRRKFVKKLFILTAVRFRSNLHLPLFNQDHWWELIDKYSGKFSILIWQLVAFHDALYKTFLPYLW